LCSLISAIGGGVDVRIISTVMVPVIDRSDARVTPVLGEHGFR